jgi:hypothetical protein
MARYQRDLDAALRLQLVLAARAWLRAVITKVPSWTGQSRGSLQPIGRFLAINVPAPVSPTAPGDRSGLGQSQSMFSFTSSNGLHLMHWETHVPHYLINEYYQVSLPLIDPTPWFSLEAGERAFYAYCQTQVIQHLPNPANYFY